MSTTLAPAAISVRGLRKAYGDHVVLDGIDLDVPEGGILALLGPNGAGKTTTVQVLTTLLRADGGEVAVAGHDPRTHGEDVRRAIGVTGQFSAVDALLTGRENLRLMTRLHHLDASEGTRRATELLTAFDLLDAADRPVSTYSGGMRRRLDLAMSLVGRPRILFLDEPTTGLDPASRRRLWEVVRDLARTGTTVFLTTQYLEEADQLADRVAVLDGGRIVAEGTADELKARVGGGHVTLRLADEPTLRRVADAFGATTPGVETDVEALTVVVPSTGDVGALRDLLAVLDREGAEVESFSLHQPDLDDVFLAVTGTPEEER